MSYSGNNQTFKLGCSIAEKNTLIFKVKLFQDLDIFPLFFLFIFLQKKNETKNLPPVAFFEFGTSKKMSNQINSHWRSVYLL